MALIYTNASITPNKIDLVSGWISRQRWYAGKGGTPALRRLTAWRLDDPEGEVGIETLILVDEGGPVPVVYQVPLTYRAQPLPGAQGALVGVAEHSELGTRYVYDAPHDPVYAQCLLALAQGAMEPAEQIAADGTPLPSDRSARGRPADASGGSAPIRRATSSRVLSGEQSNTSIIAMTHPEAGDSGPVITKIFRTLAAGDNPDVILQGALAAAGSTRVPASIGSVSASWPAPDGSGDLHGHLAFAQEFLPGAQDAWREALTAAGTGVDFSAQAEALGWATAEVHALLARELPTVPADSAAIAETLAGMRARLRSALTAAPALAQYAAAIDAVFTAAQGVDWPDFQRIHGDYHLGQVLDVPERGWVLLDFEGEPLRPLAERSQPDQPLRDVAGMLRSFDYAGGSVEQQTRGVNARDWVEAASSAFLDGYAQVAPVDPRAARTLLAAYLVDKSLYEVSYEAGNRPTWIGIPLAALGRLVEPAPIGKEDPP